ncbi:MAG TPA: hypothetical protein VFR63_13645 [Gaiellaceae bacterium]|nr:hypothetical protein [Gaiellaceae bacterium]
MEFHDRELLQLLGLPSVASPALRRAPTARTRRSPSRIQRLRRGLLDAERDTVLQLRREGVVSVDVMDRLLRDIALADVRLDFER